MPPGGLPEAFLEPVEDALGRLLRRYARTHGPFTTTQVAERYELPEPEVEAALSALEAQEELVQGEMRPLESGASGAGREWCDPEVLRRLRRASIAALRQEIEPTDQATLQRFALGWHGIDRYRRDPVLGSGTRPGRRGDMEQDTRKHGGRHAWSSEDGEGQMPAGGGPDRLRELLAPLQGIALQPEVWERDVLPRRMGRYDPAWLDTLCSAGEVVWTGAGAGGGRGGRVALYFREDAPYLGPPPTSGDGPQGSLHQKLRERLHHGAAFWSDLLAELEAPPVEARQALWDLVWSGEATNDAFAPLRARRLSVAPPPAPNRRRGRFGSRRTGAQPQVQGRWSLTAGLFDPRPSEKERAAARAELLLERHGVVTRETVVAERIPGGFTTLYAELSGLETLGATRRGYFVEGLGGAQFALAAAVERLRTHREGPAEAIVLAAQDPANLYGAALPWPARDWEPEQDRRRRRPARVPGAYVVMIGGGPVLYVEAGGRGLVSLTRPDPDVLRPALEALADFVRSGGLKRAAVERFDGEPVLGSAVEQLLQDVGFRPGPRRLTLTA
jgi:ATP-dependent Lhr-like helicase